MTESLVLTGEMIAVMGVLAITIALFALEIVRVDVAAVAVMVLLGLSSLVPGQDGLVPIEHLFDGFSSNAVISIIAIMIVGAGLDKTGLMNQAAARILQFGGNTESRILAIICSTVGFISSFMQNIGAAALFLPVVNRISRRSDIPVSRLLMPMGFCAILGGTLTMVGSSPLILLNDLIEHTNRGIPVHMEPMQTLPLFAVTPVGLALLATGIIYFVFAGKYVLPESRHRPSESGRTMNYFREVYGIDGEVYEVRIRKDSPLVGKALEDVRTAGRSGWIIAMRSADKTIVAPTGRTEFQPGAEMAILGRQKSVEEFAREFALVIKPEMQTFAETMSATSAGIAEIVIPPHSNVIGKTLQDVHIRSRFGVTVLAIFRVSEVIDHDLPEVVFQAGDTLVVHSLWRNLAVLAEDSNYVVVTDFPRDDTRPEKLPYAVGCFGITLALVLFTDLRLSAALMSGAVGMVLAGVLKMEEAYRAVEWQSVFLLASLIPLGLAVESTGTAAWIAQSTLQWLGPVSPYVFQAVIALLATGFTLVVSNVGATVLLVPIAINIAMATGANPTMFALTVALATSNSFILPTHQVNALIMGPGGYRVTDFIRAGGIMTLLFLAVILAILPLIF